MRLVILSVSRVTELSVSVSGTDMPQLNLVIQVHCCLGILTSSSELSPLKISADFILPLYTAPIFALSLCFSSRSTSCYNYIAAFLFLTK